MSICINIIIYNYTFLSLLQNDETDQETSESDRESTQTSSIGRTSLGRTILNAFDERSFFHKKVYESFNIIP